MKNLNVYLTKNLPVYVIYIVLNVSVQIYISYEQAKVLAKYAQNKLNLTQFLNKNGLKYEHLCTLLCIETNLKYKENF